MMTDFQLIQWYRRGFYVHDYIWKLPDMPTDEDAINAYKKGMEAYYSMPRTPLNLTDTEILKRLK